MTNHKNGDRSWEHFGISEKTWHGLHGYGWKACPECKRWYFSKADKIFMHITQVCLGCAPDKRISYNLFWDIIERVTR